jgi:hypothetical protein
MKPTLYLSNWSSHRTPGMHGPGRKWTIMADPRHFERGEGRVESLAPLGSRLHRLLRAALADRGNVATMEAYRAAFDAAMETRLAGGLLSPERGTGYRLDGRLWAMGAPGHMTALPGLTCRVEDGDSLLCACSRDEAAAGRCHRAWAAPWLLRAGWRVVLDGAEVSGG